MKQLATYIGRWLYAMLLALIIIGGIFSFLWLSWLFIVGLMWGFHNFSLSTVLVIGFCWMLLSFNIRKELLDDDWWE